MGSRRGFAGGAFAKIWSQPPRSTDSLQEAQFRKGQPIEGPWASHRGFVKASEFHEINWSLKKDGKLFVQPREGAQFAYRGYYAIKAYRRLLDSISKFLIFQPIKDPNNLIFEEAKYLGIRPKKYVLKSGEEMGMDCR